MSSKFNNIIISVSIVISSIILAFGISKISTENRTVSVRGLAEREVDADLAVWKMSYTIGQDNLAQLQKNLDSNNMQIIEFLREYNLTENDFSILSPEINDVTTNIYLDSSKRAFNYVAKQNILIRSNKIQDVMNASKNTSQLLGKGIAISSDYDNKVNYYFNGLNQIKPQMIEEATKNARIAAEQFARDSQSKVGKIQTATQGLFSIEAAAPGLEHKKNVRVVTTIVYTLK
jgi:hypothetical protein